MTQRARERGASSVEAVLVLPAALLAFLGLAHGAIVLHAGDVAQAAAQAAYESARLADGTEADGERAGMELTRAAAGPLRDASITVTRDAREVRVTVTGRVSSLLPWPDELTRQVHGPIERWSG